MLVTDIFQIKGNKYRLVVNYYSKYIELALLEKREKYGRIIEKLKSILSSHEYSNYNSSNTGVPQLSVLGPLLYIIYILYLCLMLSDSLGIL